MRRAEGVEGAAGHAGEGGTHFATGTENEEVAIELAERVEDGRGGRAERVVELVESFDGGHDERRTQVAGVIHWLRL